MDNKLKAGLLAAIAVAAVVALGLGLLSEDDPGLAPIAPRTPSSPEDVSGTPTGGTDPSDPSAPDQPVATPTPQDPDRSPPTPEDPRRPQPPPPGTVAEAPKGSASISFRCLGPDNAPLAGVRIEARRASGAPLGSATSDASGEAQIAGAAKGESIQGIGRHALSSEGAPFGPLPAGGPEVLLRFRASALGELRGTLRDDSGQPVRLAELILVNPKSPEGEAVLDPVGMALRPDGSFIARVAVGTYTVSARAPGLSESDRTYVTVSDQGSEPVSLVLTRQASIAGSIILPRDLTANPPRSLELVWEVKAGTAENPYTRNGRNPLDPRDRQFTLPGCDAGRYRLRLEATLSDGQPRVGNWSTLDVQAGANVTSLKLSLAEALVAIQGTVKDDLGTALPNVVVRVGAQRGVSREDGRYELRGLDLGEDFLNAKAEGHAPAFQPVHFRGQRLTINLVLPRNGGVRGQVKGPDGPAARTLVLVIYEEDDGVRSHETQTDGQGYYQLEGLTPGRYTIKAGQAADPFSGGGAQVEVRPGEIAQAPSVGLER